MNVTGTYERQSAEVVLIDGKHYRMMTDEEAVRFVWGTKDESIEPGTVDYWNAVTSKDAFADARKQQPPAQEGTQQ